MHREQSGETFIEAAPPQRMGRNESLEWIDALVDWEPLAAIVAVILDAPRGRPAYRLLLMVKALLLQQWYEASDEDLEQALWDRVSFRRFVGLGLDEDAPDRSTISRVRRTLLDATLVAAQVRPPAPTGRLSAPSPPTTPARQRLPPHDCAPFHYPVSPQHHKARLTRRSPCRGRCHGATEGGSANSDQIGLENGSPPSAYGISPARRPLQNSQIPSPPLAGGDVTE